MRKLVFLSCVALGIAFAFPALAKSWSITNWDETIQIQEDSSFLVAETVTYHFEGDFTWVERKIPQTKGMTFVDAFVSDAEGNVLTGDAVSISKRGNELVYKINFSLQDTDATWTFQYRVLNGLGSFADYDELYWNVTGDQWEVPIEAVSATITLPKDADAKSFQTRMLVGPEGSQDEGGVVQIPDNKTVQFQGGPVPSQTHFTIVFGWPKGVVTVQHINAPVTALDRFFAILRWLVWLVPLFAFLWLWKRWTKHGKDEPGRTTIVPHYDPPDAVPPGVMGTLIDEKADVKDVTATIVDLAVRGYLKIIEEKKTGFLARGMAYSFEKRATPKSGVALRPYERKVLHGLFETHDVVSTDDLKNKFYKTLAEAKKRLYEEVVERGYFTKNPSSARALYIGLGAGFMFAGFFTFPLLLVSGSAIILTGLLGIIFGFFMAKRTAKGTLAFEHAQGFKMYLHTAERFRVAVMKPETFERFLPYAMVWGVEKQWAERFKDIALEPPDWYSTSAGWHGFNAVVLTSSLSTAMNASVASVLASSPSSNSGFGGGGFSGGGGGGGGGGAG